MFKSLKLNFSFAGTSAPTQGSVESDIVQECEETEEASQWGSSGSLCTQSICTSLPYVAHSGKVESVTTIVYQWLHSVQYKFLPVQYKI